ncbi:MAG: hypothetical protein ABEK03_04365 [Candidatus Bipolaricaulia bacterium]
MQNQTPDVIPPERDTDSREARSSNIHRRWDMRPLGYSSLAHPNVEIELIGEASDGKTRFVRRGWARLRDRLRRRLNSLL